MKAKHTTRRRLSRTETLEKRNLMTAISLLTGPENTLSVEGSNARDVISIESVEKVRTSPVGTFGGITGPIRPSAFRDILATIRNANGQVIQSARFDAGSVDQVIVDGLAGHDTIRNDTNLPSKIMGGSGNDLLIGGSSDDIIDGENGRDIIYGRDGDDQLSGGVGSYTDQIRGGNGDDVILGGRGDDILWGDQGDDVLKGQSGSDQLFGGADDDQLFGGTGNDLLQGQSGADALFGGDGVDDLFGGTGADRILSWQNESNWFGDYDPDRIYDFVEEDAKLIFKNGKPTINKFGVYSGGQWTQDMIERIDEAFKIIQDEVGNTSLLERSGGRSIIFHFHESAGNPAAGTRGFNGNGIHLTDSQFSRSDDYLVSYVLHEIGHNWSNISSTHWLLFKQLNSTSVNFVSDYAETGLNEDWAETFSAYFMAAANRQFYGRPGAVFAPDKLELMDDWVDTFRS